MRRTLPALPVNMKLYRHFAVATVIITACIAMFADGENSQAIEQQIAKRQTRNHVLKVQAAKMGSSHVRAESMELSGDRDMLDVRRAGNRGGFDESAAAGPGISDSGGSIIMAPPIVMMQRNCAAQGRRSGPPGMYPAAGNSGAATSGQPSAPPRPQTSGCGGASASNGREKLVSSSESATPQVSVEQVNGLVEASRQRSGASSIE